MLTVSTFPVFLVFALLGIFISSDALFFLSYRRWTIPHSRWSELLSTMHSFHLWSWNISCCFNGDYWDRLYIYGNLHASCTLEEKFCLKFSSLVLSCSLLNILVIDLWSHNYFKDPWHVIDLSASLLLRLPPRLLKA